MQTAYNRKQRKEVDRNGADNDSQKQLEKKRKENEWEQKYLEINPKFL